MKKNYTSKAVLGFICACAVFAPMHAHAADRDLMNRLDQLERQMDTLNRAVYKGDAKANPSAAGGNVPSSSISEYDARVSAIEEQNRDIINKIEKLNYDLNSLQEEFKKFQVDVEQRFQHQPASTDYSDGATPMAVGNYAKNNEGASSDSSADSASAGNSSEPVVYKNGAAEKLYNKAFSEIKGLKYDDAEKDFSNFIDQYPDHNLSPNALYWLGETYYVRGKYKEAAKSFARCFQKYPDSSKSLDSLLKLGLSLSALGKNEDACLSLEQLRKQAKNPRNPVVLRAEEEFKSLKCE